MKGNRLLKGFYSKRFRLPTCKSNFELKSSPNSEKCLNHLDDAKLTVTPQKPWPLKLTVPPLSSAQKRQPCDTCSTSVDSDSTKKVPRLAGLCSRPPTEPPEEDLEEPLEAPKDACRHPKSPRTHLSGESLTLHLTF